MTSATNRPNNYLPLPEAVLSQLADLAIVPREARKEFLDFILNTLLPDLQFAVEDRKLIGRHMKRLGKVSGSLTQFNYLHLTCPLTLQRFQRFNVSKPSSPRRTRKIELT